MTRSFNPNNLNKYNVAVDAIVVPKIGKGYRITSSASTVNPTKVSVQVIKTPDKKKKSIVGALSKYTDRTDLSRLIQSKSAPE